MVAHIKPLKTVKIAPFPVKGRSCWLLKWKAKTENPQKFALKSLWLFDCLANVKNIYKRNDRNRKENFRKENENLLMKVFAKIFFLKREIFAKEKKERNFAGIWVRELKISIFAVTTIKWSVTYFWASPSVIIFFGKKYGMVLVSYHFTVLYGYNSKKEISRFQKLLVKISSSLKAAWLSNTNTWRSKFK